MTDQGSRFEGRCWFLQAPPSSHNAIAGTPPRLVAELRLTQDRRDTTIRVAERMWVYTIRSLYRFRGVDLPGEHPCARNDLLEESS